MAAAGIDMLHRVNVPVAGHGQFFLIMIVTVQRNQMLILDLPTA